MSICEYCKKEMLESKSCDFNTLVIDGKDYKRNKCIDIKCHDCGVSLNGIHHFGCDNEYCPKCNRQLICCKCNIEGLKGVLL